VALNGVDLRLHGSEILGLVGPNGAGKTTLVDVISGAQTANGGRLTLRGAELRGPASRRAIMGLARTFQYPQLALDLSVRDNMLVGRVARRHSSLGGMIWGAIRGAFGPAPGEDRAAIESIAAEVNLEGLDRLARDLTLGEQRLVEVGRALAQNPLVLLLDEPFAGADATGISGINEVIRIVQRRGHGVVLVDHNVDLVAALVDRTMLLDGGQVAFDGDPRACLASPEMQQVYFGGGTTHGT
jgi:branched-chain amino acid transport system ATP-binding protein